MKGDIRYRQTWFHDAGGAGFDVLILVSIIRWKIIWTRWEHKPDILGMSAVNHNNAYMKVVDAMVRKVSATSILSCRGCPVE